ncbi:MAG: PfkB family carbohydrate kinase [Holophagales bacterium]|nr:PfkB family carbohydrate kinase [Holophagales bacterium]
MADANEIPFRAPTAERLTELVQALEGQRIAMLVDLVVDRFVSGVPKRISREAPVLILRWEGESVVPGGGANAVANVAALGGRPLPLGVVGDDAPGRELRKVLAERGVETGGIRVRGGYRTPTKTRILAGGRHAIKQQVVRYDIEDEWRPTTSDLEEIEGICRHLASGVGAAVVSDYGYGAASPSLLPLLRHALGDRVPILGDSRYRLAELEGLDGATPNLEEAEHLLGSSLDDEAELARRLPGLAGGLGTGFLLVTRGSSGMTLWQRLGTAQGGALAHLPVHGTDQVADVTGAGDTVIGTFALALAAGGSPLEAACLASYAGGVVVMKMGTATLTRQELTEAIRTDPGLLEGIRFDSPGSAGGSCHEEGDREQE